MSLIYRHSLVIVLEKEEKVCVLLYETNYNWVDTVCTKKSDISNNVDW